MKKRTYIAIAIVALVVIAGIVFFVSSNLGAPSSQAPQTPSQSSDMQTGVPPAAQNPSAVPPATNSQYIVTYTNSGFSPNTLAVPRGGTVMFKNSASDGVRVSSNPHPIHNGYPTTGGCVSSTFDSCAIIPPGGSWSFTFGIRGSWGYHNHLNPSEGGTIVVQ